MSNIEWTDATWNPVVGCTPVSPGCLNCYAATMAKRLHAMGQKQYVGLTVRRGENDLSAGGGRGRDVFNGTVRCLEDRLTIPLGWRKPRMVFVNSMSDLFHEAVPFEFIDKVFAVMALCPQHTFQVLTKRPERMAEYFAEGEAERRTKDRLLDIAPGNISERADLVDNLRWPLPNVWLGASAERQNELDERVPHLLRCPAAVRFLSCEPLLGPLDLSAYFGGPYVGLPGDKVIDNYNFGINWVIVGGESGPNARPCDVAWIRSIVQQCKAAGVPCFVKQLGAKPYSTEMVSLQDGTNAWHPDGKHFEWRLWDKKGGNPEEWPEDLRVRDFPKVTN